MESNWKEKSERYFKDGLHISDIAALLGVSRQSISAYLKGLPDYAGIKEQRRQDNRKRRRAYKTEKQRIYRAEGVTMAVTPETIRREHELAAIELSREKYH